MTIKLPYDTADFAKASLYWSVRIWLDEQRDVAGDRDGNCVAVDLGPRIWRGEVILADDLTSHRRVYG